MPKFRIYATYEVDLGLEVEADNEKEVIAKAKKQVPSIRAEVMFAPWEVMHENFRVPVDEVERVEETDADNNL